MKKNEKDNNKIYNYLTKILLFDEEIYDIYRYMNYMVNLVTELGIIFPSIIINNVSYKDKKIPQHWNLGKQHSLDIKKYIEDYYSYVTAFNNKEEITSILKEIIINTGF